MKIHPEVQIRLLAGQNDFQVAPKYHINQDITVYCLSMDDFKTCAPVALRSIEHELEENSLRRLINDRFEQAKKTLLNTEMCKPMWK